MSEDLIEQIKEALETGLYIDGAHHKQWALWQIAVFLGVEDAFADLEDKGIAP